MIENNYSIKHEMMYMEGFYDRNGKTCTVVKELDRIFAVDKSPLEILEFSIKEVGFNLKGALETSKAAHKDKYMCPIMVNPIMNIVVFPTKSHKRVDAIWFNPIHIFRTDGSKLMNRKTIIIFNNEHTISVDSRLSFFNSKLQIADQYRKAKVGAAKKSQSFILDQKSKKILLSFVVAVKCLTEILEII
jgi:competence protein ComK